MKYSTILISTLFVMITGMFSCQKCKTPIEPEKEIIEGEWTKVTDTEIGIKSFFVDEQDNLLYIGGYANAYIWNGENLTKIENFTGQVLDITKYKDKIYFAVYRLIYDSLFYNTLLIEWDNGDITNIYERKGLGDITTLYADKDYLLVGGSFDTINNISAKKLAKFDGENWENFGDPNVSEVEYITKFNNSYMIADNYNHSFYYLDGDYWNKVGLKDKLYDVEKTTDGVLIAERNSTEIWDGYNITVCQKDTFSSIPAEAILNYNDSLYFFSRDTIFLLWNTKKWKYLSVPTDNYIEIHEAIIYQNDLYIASKYLQKFTLK